MAGALLAVVIWQVTKGSPPAAPPSGAASNSALSATGGATATAGGTVAGAGTVEISVSASPPEAKIFLDDKPLPGNPARTTMPKDGASHQIRIEAQGYATKIDSISFERDWSMDIALTKTAADTQAKHPTGGPIAPPVDDMAHPPGKKPQRTLDTSNPYNK